MEVLSTLAAYDDFRRCGLVLTDGTAETEFLVFAESQENCRILWLNAVKDGLRLQRELDNALKNIVGLETKLFHARRLLDHECKARREAEEERDAIEKKMFTIRDFLKNDENLKEETRHQLGLLNNCQRKRKSKLGQGKEKFGNEINSTGSFMSNLSITRSDEDFLDIDKPFKKHRKSNVEGSFVDARRSRISGDGKRKSNTMNCIELGFNDKIVAQTKVTIPKGDGPIHAESSIQAVPMNDKNSYSPSAPIMIEEMTPKAVAKHSFKNVASRFHNFATKTFIRPDTCNHCQKKIKFGGSGLRCRNCRVQLHINCESGFTVACVPQSAGTPNTKGLTGFIADYAPSESPMVPAIIVHCINEIEKRGLKDVGIYRVSGSEKDIKSLKEKFIRGKTLPYLGEIDIHVLCGCIKDFLRHLREPLIPTNLWKDFSNAAQSSSTQEKVREMYAAIQKLPQPNRDTLAFILLHFLRVAECKEIKMPPTNIAKIFGPTLVGYSSNDPDQHAIFTETIIQANVMQMLLAVPADYWEQFVNFSQQDNNHHDNRDEFEIAPRYPQRKLPFYATSPISTMRKK